MDKPLRPSARTKLLDAALRIIREKGFAATSVDDLCFAAGVTKGAFFHHFKNKDALGVAAAEYWSLTTGQMFAAASFHAVPDPLDRIFAYLDLRAALLQGTLPQFTCLAGTLLQETHQTCPDIATAAYAAINGHAATLEPDFIAAILLHDPVDCPSAQSLALHTQAVLQGAFILAKGQGNADAGHQSLDHLRRYLKLLFRKDTMT